MFYAALLKHREEHLENYMGSSDSVGYSASDHQHLQPVNAHIAPQTDERDYHRRTTSGFSILNDEHLRSSFYEPPQSEQSYDPFRASKEPVVSSRGNYINVTVHRSNSGIGCGLRILTAGGSRHRESLRLEAMKRNSRKGSRVSGTSVSLKGSPAQKAYAAVQASAASTSTHSSLWIIGSSPAAFRASNPRRRGVNFSHLRRSSTASGFNSRPSVDSEATSIDHSLPALGSSFADHTLEMTPSPAAHAKVVVVSRKENRGSKFLRPSALRPNASNQYIDSEARKVSTELERFCEEAFNRSSVGSSIMTSTTARGAPYETPPSSIGPSPNMINKAAKLDKAAIENRPLPPLPTDTPRTFTMRELAETRNKLAARYANSGHDNSEYFQAVLSQLDKLLQPGVSQQDGSQENRRVASAPQGRSVDGYLPAISEERRSAESLTEDLSSIGGSIIASRDWFGQRAVTDPVTKAKPKLVDVKARAVENLFPTQSSIRVVDPSPTVAPLKIRKSDTRVTTSSHSKKRGDEGSVESRSPALGGYKAWKATSEVAEVPIVDNIAVSSELDRDGDSSPTTGEATLRKKSTGWFKRTKSEKDEDKGKERPQPSIPRQWQDLDDRTMKSNAASSANRPKTSGRDSSWDENQVQNSTTGSKESKRPFFRFFKPRPVKEDMGLRLACKWLQLSLLYDFTNSEPTNSIIEFVKQQLSIRFRSTRRQ